MGHLDRPPPSPPKHNCAPTKLLGGCPFCLGFATMAVQVCCLDLPFEHNYANSIAFGSAPRRDADSQPISPLARPAVSQTETHSLGFLSVADAAPSSGEIVHFRASSGRTVMHLTADLLVGGPNPDRANMAPLPPPTVGRPGFKPPPENFASAALPFDWRWCDSDMPPHCLEPSERKTFDPPPQKSDIQF